MTRIAYEIVKKEYDSKEISVINAQVWKESGLTLDNHPYIVIKSDKHDKPIIIDVLLKNIFMLHRGQKSKVDIDIRQCSIQSNTNCLDRNS